MTLKELRLPAFLLSAVFAVAAITVSARDKDDKVTEKFSQTYPLGGAGNVVLSNINGNVQVVAWDRDEVSLEAEKFAPDEENLKRIEIIVEPTADKLVVKTKHHKRDSGDRAGRREAKGGVRYQLKVPANLEKLRIDAMNANVTVEGVRGNVDLDTMNGRIEARGLMANASLDTMNGSIDASFDRVGGSQKISLDSMNGSCTVHVPADASARIDASTMNGSARSDLPITLERAGKRRLRGSIGSGEASIELDSMNGSLNIRSKS